MIVPAQLVGVLALTRPMQFSEAAMRALSLESEEHCRQPLESDAPEKVVTDPQGPTPVRERARWLPPYRPSRRRSSATGQLPPRVDRPALAPSRPAGSGGRACRTA